MPFGTLRIAKTLIVPIFRVHYTSISDPEGWIPKGPMAVVRAGVEPLENTKAP